MLRFFRVYGMSCVATMLILWVSVTPKMPDLNLPDFNLKDKIFHGGAYFVLGLILCYELFRQRFRFTEKTMFVWAIIYPILLGGVIELIQANLTLNRSGDWFDWLADIIGVVLAFLVARHFYPKYLEPESKGLSCR